MLSRPALLTTALLARGFCSGNVSLSLQVSESRRPLLTCADCVASCGCMSTYRLQAGHRVLEWALQAVVGAGGEAGQAATG